MIYTFLSGQPPPMLILACWHTLRHKSFNETMTMVIELAAKKREKSWKKMGKNLKLSACFVLSPAGNAGMSTAMISPLLPVLCARRFFLYIFFSLFVVIFCCICRLVSMRFDSFVRWLPWRPARGRNDIIISRSGSTPSRRPLCSIISRIS